MRALGLDMPWPGGADSAALGDAPAADRFQLFDEVTSALLAESRIQPLLLLLDDLHGPTRDPSGCSASWPGGCRPEPRR